MAFELIDLLKVAVNKHASDLHLMVGVPPVLRIYGEIIVANGDPFDCYDDLTYALAAFRRLRAPPSRN